MMQLHAGYAERQMRAIRRSRRPSTRSIRIGFKGPDVRDGRANIFSPQKFCWCLSLHRLLTLFFSSPLQQSLLQQSRRGLVVRASDVDDELAAVSAAVEVSGGLV